jgi:hypothetical protein
MVVLVLLMQLQVLRLLTLAAVAGQQTHLLTDLVVLVVVVGVLDTVVPPPLLGLQILEVAVVVVQGRHTLPAQAVQAS